MSDEGRRAVLGSMAGLGLIAALPADAQGKTDISIGENPVTPPDGGRPPGPGTPTRSRQEVRAVLSMAREQSQLAHFTALKSKYISSFSNLIAPLSAGTDLRFKQITAGLVFGPQPLDRVFNPFQVETLLDQASNILDRAIRDRTQYEVIAAEYFTLMTELGEFLALDEIHKEEEAAGIYDVEWTSATSELKAEYEIRDLNYFCEFESGWTHTALYSPEAMREYSGAAQCSATMSGLVPYSFQDQAFAGYQSHSWNSVSKPLYLHMRDSAFTTSWHYVQTQEWAVKCARRTYEGQWNSSIARLAGLENKANWENKRRSFQRRRTVVARNVQDVRLQAAVSDDGVLNSSRRLPAIKRRFEQDFNNALGRLRAASQGLDTLFGYTDPLPSDVKNLDFFDECLSWARRSTDWLIRFARLEQSYVHVVSLRDALGRSAFNAGRSTRRWQLPITHDSFPGMSHVRMRGLSVFVDDALIKRAWKLKVAPPRSSEMRQQGGSIKKLDQSEIRPVVVGRAAEYGSPRDPDINGTSSLMNVSPIGRWEIELWGETPSTDHLAGLDDVVLHLITVYTAE